MNTEIDRVKTDLETIQKAIGPAPNFGREWLQWLKRDNWSSLWWCLPGVVFIIGALLPFDDTKKFFGLLPDQWVCLLAAVVTLGILFRSQRRLFWNAARPAGLVRVQKKLNIRGYWLLLAIFVQFLFYLIWAKQSGVGQPAILGLYFLVAGSASMVMAIAWKAWAMFGWAIAFLACGVCQPAVMHSRLNGILLTLGMLFIIGSLLSSVFQALQLRKIESQHVTD
jgi:hypothetical protein